MSDIVHKVKELRLPLGEYAVVGGGALSVRGIRDHDDIDLLVTRNLYEKLKREGWTEKEEAGTFHLYKGQFEAVEGFSHLPNCYLTIPDVITGSEIIDGIPFMSLPHVILIKQSMGREKDKQDIELIKKHQMDSLDLGS